MRVANSLSFADVVATNKPAEGPVGVPPQAADVAIVGGGPIGLLAANLLGLHNVKTVVIERNRLTSDQPKAVIMDDEFLRLIDRLGLYEALQPHLTSVPFGIHFYSPLGFELVKAEGFITPNGFANRNSVSQPMLEKILLQNLQRFGGVTVCYRQSVKALSQTDDGVEIAVEDEGGQRRRIVAKYLFGCDGVHSFVRETLGIPFEGVRLNEPHLVIDFAEFPDQSPFSRFFCDPRRPFNSILMPYGGRRIEFMLMGGDDREAIKSFESIQRLVKQHTPYADVELKVVRSAVYGYSARVAGQLQKGRVFLLGDAAHVMPPFGSSGMNTGARDANNLVWKIAMVLNGLAAESILDSYDPERRPQIEAVVKYSVLVGRLANMRSWPLALIRDAFFAVANLFPRVRRYFRDMRYMPKPAIIRGLIMDRGDDASLVGRMFPRLTLSHDAGKADFDTLCGSGFSLIGVDVGDETLAKIAALSPWSGLKPGLVSVRLDGAPLASGLCIEDERQRAMLAPHRGEIAILRPDRYTAAIAPAQDILDRADVYGRKLGLLSGELTTAGRAPR
ncbi:MAG TPA: FAD-dependent monooxygenase [Pseudolabrys sp.]|nr:FAD-dependent monooxygenase [Pseudolabrys sp.]